MLLVWKISGWSTGYCSHISCTRDFRYLAVENNLFIEHITKGRELNLFINNIELMIREVPPYLVACFTIWRKIPRDIESAPYVCVDNGKSYWRLRRHRRRRTLSYCGAADYDGKGGCFVCCIRSAWWQQCPRNMPVFQTCLTFTMQFYNGLYSIVRHLSDVSLPHFADTVAADGLDAQSLGTDVYCVIVCHWFPRDMSEYTTSVPSDCALTLFGAGTSGTAMLKHISSTLAQSPVIVQWLVYRPGCAPLTALTGGAVCCHLLTASGAPSDDRIAAVMVLCA